MASFIVPYTFTCFSRSTSIIHEYTTDYIFLFMSFHVLASSNRNMYFCTLDLALGPSLMLSSWDLKCLLFVSLRHLNWECEVDNDSSNNHNNIQKSFCQNSSKTNMIFYFLVLANNTLKLSKCSNFMLKQKSQFTCLNLFCICMLCVG